MKLAPARESEVVEELAQHLEERYREMLDSGATETEAREKALAELSDPNLLKGELRKVEQAAERWLWA